MSASLGWVVAAVMGAAWWWCWRSQAHDWAHLGRLLRELSSGVKPAGFVFRHGGRFAQLTDPLEKLAEAQEQMRLRLSEDAFHLRTILASMEEGVAVVDGQHLLQLVNPSFLRIFEIKSDPRGQTILHALRETPFEEIISKALSSGEAQAAEITMTGRKPPRAIAAHAVPFREVTGVPGVVMIARDVSRLKQLEEVRREFVANVSHELRTPLSIFQGYLENLIDDPKMSRQEQATIFKILCKHSLRLNALLEDLLTLARLESRHERLERTELDLREVIQSVAGDWTAKMRSKDLTLDVEVAADLPMVSADRLRLEQVLNNLLENAVKYTASEGRIVIRAVAETDAVVLCVEDTGAGIPPADLPHIFERFYRADKSRTREQGGTGLGLSIVKHIVHLHGGTVCAESQYGRGTTIILRLPHGS